MSTYTDKPNDAAETEKPCRGIERLLQARLTDLGNFGVRRLLPTVHQRMIGPWIFFDHFGPTDFSSPRGVDIRPHPHINMATVTYLFEGAMLHQDSTGAIQTISPGAVNVMFAGKGIVHSERTPVDVRNHGFTLHGLQLWLAVPENIEEDAPQFYHFASEDVPVFQQGDVKGRVLMGSAYGVQSPVKVFSPTLYVEAFIPKGSRLATPNDPAEIGIYVVSGNISSGDITFETGMMAVSTHHDGIEILALEDSRVALIGGEPLGKRHIWWNFVSSQKERILKAAQDWEDGLFPQIPSDHDDFIPLPEQRI